jgi:hypothetical protein
VDGGSRDIEDGSVEKDMWVDKKASNFTEGETEI